MPSHYPLRTSFTAKKLKIKNVLLDRVVPHPILFFFEVLLYEDVKREITFQTAVVAATTEAVMFQEPLFPLGLPLRQNLARHVAERNLLAGLDVSDGSDLLLPYDAVPAEFRGRDAGVVEAGDPGEYSVVALFA